MSGLRVIIILQQVDSTHKNVVRAMAKRLVLLSTLTFAFALVVGAVVIVLPEEWLKWTVFLILSMILPNVFLVTGHLVLMEMLRHRHTEARTFKKGASVQEQAGYVELRE